MGNKSITDNKERIIIYLLLVCLIVLTVISLCFGRYKISIFELSRLILKKENLSKQVPIIFYNIRLPRILLAILVGAALASAGSVYQTAFRNFMASPDILGASSGAAFGASLAIILKLSENYIILCAFTFSVISVFLAFFVSENARGKRLVNLILSGMMVSSLFSAGTSYIKLIANPNTELSEITFWLMGSLSAAKKEQVYFAFIIMSISYLPLYLLRWRINILSFEDSEAKVLGINSKLLRIFSLAFSTLLIATAVSVSGIISWIGLIVPHFARKMVGNNLRFLLPASTVLGSIFLLIVDDISRNLLKTELPIGILTALVGAPFFMYLFTRKD